MGTYKGRRWLVQVKHRSHGSTQSNAVEEAFNAQWAYDADVIVTATNVKFSTGAINSWKEYVGRGFVVFLWNQENLLSYEKSLPVESLSKKGLRKYQKNAVKKIHLSLDSGEKKGLITLATGLGKTIVASTFISEYLEKNQHAKVLVLAHLKDLVRQLDRSCWSQFSKFIETHIWTDGEKPAYAKGVTFATIQTVVSAINRGDALKGVFDLVIVDECHHGPSRAYAPAIQSLPSKYLLGLTATPFRGDGQSLEPLFGNPIFSMDVVEGMQAGYLSKVDYQMMTEDIDWDEIRLLSKQGLTIKDLNTKLYVPERDIGMIEMVSEVIKKTVNDSTLVFCRSIDHAERLQQYFRLYGISAGVLHSKLHRSVQFVTLSNFRMGKIRVLVSIEMLNEGIDVPEVNIVVFARVTHSRRIFLQQLGRGLRLSKTKTHVKVLDFVADIRRVAEGLNLNNLAQGYKEKEIVNYGGEIVKFSKNPKEFFDEYLADMADISNLDENLPLKFP